MRLLVSIIALVVLTAACMRDTESGNEFALQGEVTAVQADAGPEIEVSVETEDTNDDAEGEPESSGAIQVRTTDVGEELVECDLDESALAVFWTEETDFDPASTVDDADFPNNLRGARVGVEGRVFGLDDEQDETAGCTLVADEIQVAAVAATASPGASPAPDGGPATASPAASPTPTTATFVPPTPSP